MAVCEPHHLPVGSKLKYGVLLTVLILAVEIVGGVISNSLALLSDAGHVFVDIIALALSWYGVRQAERVSHKGMTFGYHRVGVIVAIINALSIFAIAAVIFFEAYERWQRPPEVNSLLMLIVAVVGISVNIFVVSWLRQEQKTNLNVRSAFWHAMGDALASVGVIIGGLVILFTRWFVVDAIVSVFIGLIITFSAWRILREGFKVLLEATPHQIDVHKMVDALQGIPGVKGIHDVHVWSISPELHAMSSHVLIGDVPMSQAAEIREKIEKALRERFDIEHSVLQLECTECSSGDLFCSLSPGEPKEGHEGHEGHQH